MCFRKRKNLKQMVANKELPLGFIVNLTDTRGVEIAGLAGYDFIRVDGEHCTYNLETIQQIVQAADLVGLPVIVRIPEPGCITALLDCGVAGIMAPHVRSAEQAKELVDMVKYAPVGRRGFTNNGRVHHYGMLPFDDYVEQTRDEVILEIQIEDAEGLANMESIIATEGVDWVCSGRGDISQALGLLGQTNHPKVVEMEDKILETARRHGKYGQLTTGNLEQAKEFIDKGVAAITVASDLMLMVPAIQQSLANIQEARDYFKNVKKAE